MKEELLWKNPGYKGHHSLKGEISCDVLVVGGGVAGVSLAYFLAKAKRDVVLIEKNLIASGATGHAAGTLSMRGEADILELLRHFGPKKGRAYWKTNQDGIRIINQMLSTEKIPCDYEPMDTLYGGYRHTTYNDVRAEYHAERSIDSRAKLYEGKAVRTVLNTPLFSHALLSKGHGISVNPLACTQNLSVVAKKRGARIYEHTPLVHLHDFHAHTPQGAITFKHIVFCMDKDPSQKDIKYLRTTLVATRKLTKAELKKTGFHDKNLLVFEPHENYHYFKRTKDGRLLVGFGGIFLRAKMPHAQPHPAHVRELKSFLKRLFPYLDLRIDYAWSGDFGVGAHYHPHVHHGPTDSVIAGCGTQVACVMAAKHIADILCGKKKSHKFLG